MKHAQKILAEEIAKLGGVLFTDFLMRQTDDDATKKAIEDNDFLIGMFNGNLKAEWKLEETDAYKMIIDLTRAIKILQDADSSS